MKDLRLLNRFSSSRQPNASRSIDMHTHIVRTRTQPQLPRPRRVNTNHPNTNRLSIRSSSNSVRATSTGMLMHTRTTGTSRRTHNSLVTHTSQLQRRACVLPFSRTMPRLRLSVSEPGPSRNAGSPNAKSTTANAASISILQAAGGS